MDLFFRQLFSSLVVLVCGAAGLPAAQAQLVVVGVGCSEVEVVWSAREYPFLLAAPMPGEPILGAVIEESLLGVEVKDVLTGSAADRAGLAEGDQIIEINRVSIESPSDVLAALRGYRKGVLMELVAIRRNRRLVRRFRFVSPRAWSQPAIMEEGQPAVAPGSRGQLMESGSSPTQSQLDALTREIELLRRQLDVVKTDSEE